MKPQLLNFEESPVSGYSVEHIGIPSSEAIIQAGNDFDSGEFHLFQAMQEYSLSDADKVYFNEMRFLINSRRYLA